MFKRFVTGLLTLLLLVLSGAVVSANAITEISRPILTSTSPLTSGAVLGEYLWLLPDGPARAYVIEVDLTNPSVQVDVVPGAGQITKRLNVSAMARNSGAVAAVNGDFFNTRAEGAPIGPMVTAGRFVSSPAVLIGTFALGITADRRAYIDSFTFQGKVVAPNGREFDLSGLNKTVYWEEPSGAHSHANKLHLYNDMWGGPTRGHDAFTVPTEMLIADGTVVDIVRGSYFNGPVPAGMYILRGHGHAANFLVENFVVGDSIHIHYAISPAQNWSMIVGGHALLVDEGKAVPYTKDIAALGGVRARTAAAISRDGGTLYLVSVEGRTPGSNGLSLADLSAFLETLGVWKAVNLDGGGSTTMVSRPLGEFATRRVFSPEQPNERLVVNAVGVFSRAPQGRPQGFVLSNAAEVLLIGEEVTFSIRAYDEFFNPVDTAALPIDVTVSGTAGIFRDNRFTATQPGLAETLIKSGSVSSTHPFEVVGRRDISTFTVFTAAGNIRQVSPGSRIPLNILLQTVSGKNRIVAPHLVNWQLFGFKGSVSPQGILTIEETGNSSRGFAVARYQGFSAPLAIQLAAEPEPAQTLKTMVMTVGEKILHINGETHEMDVAPLIINGRTLVPVRFVSEALGAHVLWDGLTRNATVIQGMRWIDLWPGEDIMVVDGKRAALDVAPQIIGGRTMLPLRAVSQALNLTVHWDAGTRQITLH